jgi:S1-C subfamily serine protease
VLLAALIGACAGGASAWAIYQHYGPVQRIVNQQINGSSSGSGQTVGQLAAAHAGSVVTIATQPVTSAELADGTASLVSGVVVSSNGLILTSAHAVVGASQLRVGLPEGGGFDAEIAGVDEIHGLAVLRIPGVAGLTPVTLGPSVPAVGAQAIALSRSISGGLGVGVGTVSAVGLTVATDTATGASVQAPSASTRPRSPGPTGRPC